MSVVGIDLGTTNTVVACVRSGKVHVLADEHGARLLPSVVSFHPNGEVLVGASAKSRRIIDPKHTVYSHKRLIGRSWGSPEIALAKSRFAFELKEGPGQGPLIRARGQDYTLPEISAFVLKRTRQIAETALGTPVERAVITVPAHFNELQRASTKVAGRVSGLEVLRILNEPTAAALAYGLGRAGNERVAVYDFGGGTFDCTLLDLNGNVFEVLATAGDSFLGGDDVDNLIAERMAETYLKAYRYDPRTDPVMLERLKTTAEDIKLVLSSTDTHTIVLKEFGHGAQGAAINYTFTMTRRDLDQMITPLVDRSFKVTQDALSLARLTPTSFDKIILVGGSTRMPLVRKRVEAFFGQAPLDRVNPDEVVAIGAAIQAAALTEGARRRSIPAPPNVIGKPHKLPEINPESSENTQTGTLDPNEIQSGTAGSTKPLPAFASQPPSFGFHPASAPPPAPPPVAGATGARSPNASRVGGPHKITDPGFAAQTQPMDARPLAPPALPGEDDDPSIASFPDLAVPAPFEWFPSAPSSSDPGETAVRTAPTGFGAIDEPPSLATASIPSFPSMTARGSAGRMPSPLGEPEPFRADRNPGGQFGAVAGPSLVSTTGVAGAPGDAELGFGYVSDLSLVSSSSQTGHVDGITVARQKLLEDFDGDTQANGRADAEDLGASRAKDNTFGLDAPASAGGHAPAPLHSGDDAADLPSVAQSTGLPSVAAGGPKGKRPEVRKPGQPGMNAAGGPSMVGKPPPMLAPQPFGPMQKVAAEGAPASRTAAIQARSQPQAPARTGAMPARGAGPMNTTAPLNQPPPFNPTAPRNQTPPPFGSGLPTAAFGSAPPARITAPGGHAFGGAPGPVAQTAPMNQAMGDGRHAAFQSSPGLPPHPPQGPPALQPQANPFAGFGSGPPAAPFSPAPGTARFGSAPPPEAPLDFNAMQQQDYNPNTAVLPGTPGMAQSIAFAAPVLVDVTPRGLVVETAGGYTDTIIPRNAKIPCERTRRFATGRDMQTTVRVRVGQGEHNIFPQNTFLGEVELSGLRPAPRGEVVVAVTFEVDADGTLRIRARDVQTGQEARATLQLIGVADESSVVMMINRFAKQPVVGEQTRGPR